MPKSTVRITTLTSREFNQDTARAKKAAAHGPVVITDRGQPAHVLLTYKRFQELAGERPDIVRLIGMVDDTDIGFEPAKAEVEVEPPVLD